MIETFANYGVPAWYAYTVLALFGAVLGSFINVLAYRLHTGKSINGRSRCFSCAHTLRWYELIPIVSYSLQRGRCRDCQARIPGRDFLVEVIFALAVLVTAITATSVGMFFGHVMLISLLLLIIIYDIVHLIIPNEFVWMLTGVAAVLVLPVTMTAPDVPSVLLSVVVGGVAGFVSYGSLWLISSGRWIGLGDAKLAIPLGMLVGPIGMMSLFVFSFWVGAIIGLLLIGVPMLWSVVQRGYYQFGQARSVQNRYNMKSEIPFAPFIIIAFWLVYMYQLDVVSIVSYVFSI